MATLPGDLRPAPRVFDRTGGLHAARLFDAEGRLPYRREYVGRHNAADKAVGWALRNRGPAAHRRRPGGQRPGPVELVQAAAMAGIPLPDVVSAPSCPRRHRRPSPPRVRQRSALRRDPHSVGARVRDRRNHACSTTCAGLVGSSWSLDRGAGEGPRPSWDFRACSWPRW
ncbi:formate dehydrogenase accessory sulfurtransferase FdhD [Saccharothrix stipae]